MRTASPATFTHDKATAHTQMRTTQRKLPFTYRTFGVSGAQPQSHYSQHAGYSQHLLGRDSAPGRRRDYTASSFFFSPLSFFFFFFLFPSPFRPLPLIQRLGSSPLLFEQSVETVHWYVGQDRQRGAEEEHRGAREAPRRTVTARAAPLVVWTVEAATKVVSAETGPESSAPRDQTERRHREDGFSRFFFSRSLPLSLSSTPPPTTFYLSPSYSHTHTRASILRPPLSSSHLLSLEHPSPLQLTEAATLRRDPS